MTDRIKSWVISNARDQGFGEVRFATASVPLDADRLWAMVEQERHGEMAFLAESVPVRVDPGRWLGGARTVVVMAMDYGMRPPPDPGGLTGRVASYAWGRDYHNRILSRLRKLRNGVEAAFPGVRARTSIDHAPVFERAFARAAGLGWVGKNCCSIVVGKGSLFFLATMMLSVEVEPDAPAMEHCGRCTRCLVGCPTGAFVGPNQLDARRCISYLTIEHRGGIPENLRALMGRWILGCDDCQTVCPHNRYKHDVDSDFFPRHAWLPLPALLFASDAALLDTFEGSPIRRACPEKIRRNAAVALGNIGDPRGRHALEFAARGGGMVGEHAEWALARLTKL